MEPPTKRTALMVDRGLYDRAKKLSPRRDTAAYCRQAILEKVERDERERGLVPSDANEQ